MYPLCQTKPKSQTSTRMEAQVIGAKEKAKAKTKVVECSMQIMHTLTIGPHRKGTRSEIRALVGPAGLSLRILCRNLCSRRSHYRLEYRHLSSIFPSKRCSIAIKQI